MSPWSNRGNRAHDHNTRHEKRHDRRFTSGSKKGAGHACHALAAPMAMFSCFAKQSFARDCRRWFLLLTVESDY